MRVAIIGAGAMGSIYGAMFHSTGHEVWMIDRNKAIVDAIRTQGMTITGADRERRVYPVNAASDPAEIVGQADLIVFQVKGFATADAARHALSASGPETVVLTLQNGLGNEEAVAEVFPGNVLLLGISVHSASMEAPGLCSHTGVRETWVGPAKEEHFAYAGRIAEALAASGFAARAVHETEIRREIFSKWVLNCGSLPVAALTQLATADLAVNEDALSIVDGLTREACELAALEGYRLDADERVAFNRELFRTAGGKASMLQDILAGRRTEIETISGSAVRLADRHGIPAILCRTVYALVRAREAAMARQPAPVE